MYDGLFLSSFCPSPLSYYIAASIPLFPPLIPVWLTRRRAVTPHWPSCERLGKWVKPCGNGSEACCRYNHPHKGMAKQPVTSHGGLISWEPSSVFLAPWQSNNNKVMLSYREVFSEELSPCRHVQRAGVSATSVEYEDPPSRLTIYNEV